MSYRSPQNFEITRHDDFYDGTATGQLIMSSTSIQARDKSSSQELDANSCFNSKGSPRTHLQAQGPIQWNEKAHNRPLWVMTQPLNMSSHHLDPLKEPVNQVHWNLIENIFITLSQVLDLVLRPQEHLEAMKAYDHANLLMTQPLDMPQHRLNPFKVPASQVPWNLTKNSLVMISQV